MYVLYIECILIKQFKINVYIYIYTCIYTYIHSYTCMRLRITKGFPSLSSSIWWPQRNFLKLQYHGGHISSFFFLTLNAWVSKTMTNEHLLKWQSNKGLQGKKQRNFRTFLPKQLQKTCLRAYGEEEWNARQGYSKWHLVLSLYPWSVCCSRGSCFS